MSTEETPVGTLRTLPDGRHEGVLARLYAGHDRAALWAKLTEPAQMAQWLAPGTIEPRVGGAVKIDFADSGIVIESTVLDIEPQRRLSYSWSSGNEPERPLRWVIDEDPQGVRLTLTVLVPADEDPAKACAGFEGHLDMLAGALEGVPIKFPFERFLQARKAYQAQLDG